MPYPRQSTKSSGKGAVVSIHLRNAICGFSLMIVGGCGGEPGASAEGSELAIITGFVEADGANLYYEEQGDGQPVVLIHSANTNLHIWDRQFEVLSSQFRTIRYDGRGFGRSQSELVEFTDYDDLLALVDDLDLERPILIGLSLGGMTAIEFALEHPERVSGLVLAGSGLSGYAPEFPEADLERFGATRRAAAEGDFETAANLMVEGYLDAPGRPWTEVDPGLRERLKGMILQSANRFALNNAGLHHFLDPPAIGRLGEITVPTLVILGEHESPNEYGIADLLEQSIPNLTRAIIPESKHLTSMENPDAFNLALSTFLAEVDEGPRGQS